MHSPQTERAAIRALALACALLTGLSSRGAVAESPGLLTPGGPGARHYFAPTGDGRGLMRMDGLARDILDDVKNAARSQGLAPPAPDARLALFADTLASSMPSDELPGIELQEFLLSHYGLGDPPPHLVTVQVGASDGAIRDRIAKDLPGLLRAGGFSRIAVGIHRRWFQTSLVLALQNVGVQLLPIPRRLPLDGSALIGGSLTGTLRDPRVLVAAPGADVRKLEVRPSGDSFRASFRCDAGPGKYQVELTGTGREGKTLVANFPIYCGIEPPLAWPRGSSRPGSYDPRREEKRMLELVNRDRAAVGLPRVVWDEALAKAALAYSAELAGRSLVRHVSPSSGDAADRVRRAGVEATFVYENVARARSTEEAERSFLSSPGHRANVLHRMPTRLGVGITIRKDVGGSPLFYVTQLFAR